MGETMRTMAKDRPGNDKRYLGDGVYAVHDGRGIWLTTENGEKATNEIYLEPHVMDALDEFSRVRPTP